MVGELRQACGGLCNRTEVGAIFVFLSMDRNHGKSASRSQNGRQADRAAENLRALAEEKAAQLLKRYGDKKTTYDKFITESGRCSSPLDKGELDQIWTSAIAVSALC